MQSRTDQSEALKWELMLANQRLFAHLFCASWPQFFTNNICFVNYGRKSNPCPRNSGKNPGRGPPKSAQGRRPRADFGGPRAGFFPAIPRYEGLDFSIIIYTVIHLLVVDVACVLFWPSQRAWSQNITHKTSTTSR